MVLVINVGGDLVVSYLVISCVMSCDDGVWSVGVVAWDFQSSLQFQTLFLSYYLMFKIPSSQKLFKMSGV